MKRQYVKGDAATRFWPKVDKSAGPDGCWLWRGARSSSGYGTFNLGGGRYTYAHRFVMGDPDGHVCHRCDNPRCCNPAHLFVGTNSDNIADRVAKGRSYNGVRRRALTDEQAADLRAFVELGWSVRHAAHAYGISHSTAAAYVRGTHAHH